MGPRAHEGISGFWAVFGWAGKRLMGGVDWLGHLVRIRTVLHLAPCMSSWSISVSVLGAEALPSDFRWLFLDMIDRSAWVETGKLQKIIGIFNLGL